MINLVFTLFFVALVKLAFLWMFAPKPRRYSGAFRC
jgi:hypothetical protein